MPILPDQESSQSVFNNQPLGYQNIQGADASAFGAGKFQAAGGLGQSLENADTSITQSAINVQAVQNETNTNDTYYKNYFPQATQLTQGYLATQGKDAVDGMPAYMKSMEDLREQTRAQLANPQQQQMFDNISRKLESFNMDGAARHQTQQNTVYEDMTSQGMVSASGQLAVQHWNDPVGFNVGLASGVNEIMTHAQFRGMPIEAANAKAAQFTSQTYAARLQEMSISDPVGAYDLYKNGETYNNQAGKQVHTDVSNMILGDIRPSLEAHLLAAAKDTQTSILAHQAINGGPLLDPLTVQPGIQNQPPLQAVVQKLEGGTAPDGSPLTSSKGATGAMQVMPTTASNPGYGVTPAKDNSAAEIARVGTDYLGAMTARYQNPALVLAAYNAGPAVVDDWLNGTNKSGKNPNNTQLPDPRVTGDNMAFANAIPFGETSKYVGGGLGMIKPQPNQNGQLPTTSQLKTQLPDIVESAREAAERMYPNDPRFADAVAARTANNGNTILSGVTAQQNAARDTLNQLMLGSKPDGSDRANSVDQLIGTPQGQQAWAQATPEVKMSIQNALAKPQNVPMTQEGFNAYYQLRGQAVNDPTSFAAADLSKLYGQMPLTEIKELTGIQAALFKHDASTEDKSVNWDHTKGTVDDMLKPMGLGSVAKPNTDEMNNTEMFYGKLQSKLEQYHDQNQKYPDDITLRKIASGLLVNGTTPKPGLIYGTNDKPVAAYQVPAGAPFTATIPDDQKQTWTDKYTKVYGKPPTDDQLSQLYTAYTQQPPKGK
jgi:soluble lytic murein transglycosylase